MFIFAILETDEQQLVLILPGHYSKENEIVRAGFTTKIVDEVISNDNPIDVIEHEQTNSLQSPKSRNSRSYSTNTSDLSEFLCDLCGKSFKLKRQLKNHRFKMHSPIKLQFKCDVCEMSFTLQSALKSHSRIHEEPKFRCTKCLVLFKTKYSLKRHNKLRCPIV